MHLLHSPPTSLSVTWNMIKKKDISGNQRLLTILSHVASDDKDLANNII